MKQLISIRKNTEHGGYWQDYEIERPQIASSGCSIYSGAFICPICLNLWAYATWDNDIRQEVFHEIRDVPCEACPQGYDELLRPVPGSILDNWNLDGQLGIDIDLIDFLPEHLIRRELDLTLRMLENE